MVTLAREILFEVVEDVQPLLQAHYEELCLSKDRMALDPMWERYAQLEATDRDALQIYTARDEGALIGYAAFFVTAHLHYRAFIPAINDVLFISPVARGSTGLRFIRYCEQELARFAQKIVWRVKSGTPMHLLLQHPKLGYALDELAYGKFLNPVNASA